MKKIQFLGLGVLLIALLCGAAHEVRADRKVVEGVPAVAGIAAGKMECSVKETANINVSFNNLKVDVDAIRATVEGKIEQIKAMARDMGIESIKVQNFSYNIYSNGGGGDCCGDECEKNDTYQSNGSVSFVVEPVAKATAFSKALIKKGFLANLNVNGYSQCGENGNYAE